MLNYNFFSPRNFLLIGLIAFIWVLMSGRVMRAVNGNKQSAAGES